MDPKELTFKKEIYNNGGYERMVSYQLNRLTYLESKYKKPIPRPCAVIVSSDSIWFANEEPHFSNEQELDVFISILIDAKEEFLENKGWSKEYWDKLNGLYEMTKR